jgi:hypothetical protein
MNCPQCQAEVAAAHAFCMACGTRIAPDPSSENSQPAPDAAVRSSSSTERLPGGGTSFVGAGSSLVGASTSILGSSTNLLGSAVDGPLLEIRDPGRLQVGMRVTLTGRVRWELGAGARGCLQIESTDAKRPESYNIPGTGWHPCTCELHLKQPGSCELSFRMETDDQPAYVGRLIFPVDAANEAAPIIQIHNQQSNDARIAVGQEANINVHVAGRSDRSWTDEPRYVLVELARVGSASASRVVGGTKRAHDDDRAPEIIVTKLSLRIRKGANVRNICLLGGTSLKLGKKREGNDVVLRLIPPDEPEHARQWGRISREHGEILFTSTGAEWRNGECSNGTLVDGKSLGSRQAVPLRNVQSVNPAGVLELRCTLIHEAPALAATDAYARFEKSLGALPVSHQPVGPLAAVRVNRVNNIEGLEEYLLVQRGCTIGSDVGNGIVLAEPSVSVRHALLLFNRHGFWLEPIQKQRPTLWDGEQIPAHRLVRLVPGMSPLHLGDVEIGVSTYQQWFVDVEPR